MNVPLFQREGHLHAEVMKTFIFHLEFVLLVIVCTAPRLSAPHVITDVRLVEQLQPNSGRVQVQIDNSTWLDVCDGMWDNEEGQVVCRQLGFPGLAQRLRGLAFDGQRSTTSVRNFHCMGSESSLSECEHESRDDMSMYMCGSDRGAGVTCSVITDVRLVEGQPNSGRVQVQIKDSRWLDVCDNRWGIEEGRVVCRQLGFPGLAARLGGIRIGNRSTESVWNFECEGSESSLSECRHVRSDVMCGPKNGAGVTCSGVITDVRLVEGQPHSGRVQVQIEDSAWLDVCENGWSNEDGRVVCQQLGFQDLSGITTRLSINNPSLKAVRDIICDGAEASLSACEYRSVGNCGSNNDRGAGVICVPFPTTEPPTQATTAVRSPTDRTTEGATTQSTAGDGGFDTRGSNSGTYIGLAVGCVLFVVCVSVIVVCFLKRHKRQDKPTPTATLQPSAGFQQHSKTQQIPNHSDGDDVNDHYYSSAKLDTTKPSDPPEDSVYTYADAPRKGANNKPPNTNYFMIKEGGNFMGSPQQPATESEYAYADPTQLREESPDETEGWVENIVYVAGP